MSFQVMVNPPGGVWQDDECAADLTAQLSPGNSPASAPFCTKHAGTSIFGHNRKKRFAYLGLVSSATSSFAASLSLILLVISGMRLRNRLVMAILKFFMVMAVVWTGSAFYFSAKLVHSDDESIEFLLDIYWIYWLVFLVVIVLIQLVRFLVRILCLVFRCCKPRRRLARPLRP